jgi:organic hydroperoxide reductase OsmC/OhrA
MSSKIELRLLDRHNAGRDYCWLGASAGWRGKINDGIGTLSTQSGVLRETSYSYRSRFGDGTETKPEELITAAHAGVFYHGALGVPRERRS